MDADYSQIELRVLAHMSGDEQLIEAYRMEQDIHRMTQAVTEKHYPPLGERNIPDMHTAFYGEIVNAYLIEQE